MNTQTTLTFSGTKKATEQTWGDKCFFIDTDGRHESVRKLLKKKHTGCPEAVAKNRKRWENHNHPSAAVAAATATLDKPNTTDW